MTAWTPEDRQDVEYALALQEGEDPGMVDNVLAAAAHIAARHQDPAEAMSPEAAVADAMRAAAVVDVALAGYDPDDWRDALRLLRHLRRATASLATTDATLVRWLYLHGEHGQHQTLDGIPGEFYIGRGRSKERWATPEVVRDYVEARIRANDGEAPDPYDVVEWVLEVLPSGASTSVKVTPLREVGLDPQDYRTSEPGTIRVDLPREGPMTEPTAATNGADA